MTSSDQSNEVLTNQATKTKINVTLLALVSRAWHFPVVAAFVVPRFPPIGYFLSLDFPVFHSSYKEHEESPDSTRTLMSEKKYLRELAFCFDRISANINYRSLLGTFFKNTCLFCSTSSFRGCLSHNSPIRGRVRSIFSDEERSPRCRT